jgi:hypothetical protein
MTLDEIIKGAQGETEAAIRQAFFLGVEEGRRLAKIEILNVLTSSSGGSILDNYKKATAPSEPDMFAGATPQTDSRAKRAPKGLTKRVLRKVFEDNPKGLKMEAVQEAAVAFDNRISPKTVYNDLYRRTDAYFRDDGGLWHLRSQARGGNAAWLTSEQETVQ